MLTFYSSGLATDRFASDIGHIDHYNLLCRNVDWQMPIEPHIRNFALIAGTTAIIARSKTSPVLKSRNNTLIGLKVEFQGRYGGQPRGHLVRICGTRLYHDKCGITYCVAGTNHAVSFSPTRSFYHVVCRSSSDRKEQRSSSVH